MLKKLALAFCALSLVAATPALADDHHRDRDRHWQGGHDRGHAKNDKHYKKHHKRHYKHHEVWRHGGSVAWRSARHWGPPGHRKVVVHRHHGYGHKHRNSYRQRRDDDWAIYAILALQIVDALNESQRDHYAWAQQRAYQAPIGETIQWNDGGAYGSVIPVREGSDTAGRYCREFQQLVIVGDHNQSGYGIACRQPDGAWQIVSN